MRIGIVCPYSFDAPGGVQFHIRDLAAELRRRDHHVEILAPGNDAGGADSVTSTGGGDHGGMTTVPGGYAVSYNGSVANLCLSTSAWNATKQWISRGNFDVIHIHEPMAPSLSILALIAAESPVVATFHTAMTRSRAMTAARPLLAPLMERIGGRIAVSHEARRTLIEHQGGDAVIIPNGVDTAFFRNAVPRPEWMSTDAAPVIAFLGRLDEPRKGLGVLVDALADVWRTHPEARVLVAGRGEAVALRERAAAIASHTGSHIEFLGGIDDEDKAALLAGADLYIAPQTGGESFGIVLVEAMAAGACVVASDIEAFRLVLHAGAYGSLFSTGDSADLARVITAHLDDPAGTRELAARGHAACTIYDWQTVTDQILAIYTTVARTAALPLGEEPDTLAARVRHLVTRTFSARASSAHWREEDR